MITSFFGSPRTSSGCRGSRFVRHRDAAGGAQGQRGRGAGGHHRASHFSFFARYSPAAFCSSPSRTGCLGGRATAACTEGGMMDAVSAVYVPAALMIFVTPSFRSSLRPLVRPVSARLQSLRSVHGIDLTAGAAGGQHILQCADKLPAAVSKAHNN